MTSSPLSRRAFTLIELLIVITIIGILAVALVPRLTGGPARARDAQRQADLQQLATALEFVNNDNGGYPNVTSSGCINATNLTVLTSYLTTVPTDPNITATGGLASAEFDTGGCTTGYTYVGLKGSGTAAWNNYTATGYLLATDLETETTRGTGTYTVSGSGNDFNVTTTATAATNLSNNSGNACTNSLAPCTGSTNVIYVIGR